MYYYCKKITVILLLTIGLTCGQSIFAKAKDKMYKPGFYVGYQLGIGEVNEGNGPKELSEQIAKETPTNTYIEETKRNINNRLFLGYSFSPYFSLESGWAIYTTSKHEAGIGDLQISELGLSFETDLWTIDLMAKGVLPLHPPTKEAGWNIYGKLGAVLTTVKYTTSIKSDYLSNDINLNDWSKTAIRPGYALGIEYRFHSNFGIDLSWSGIYSSDKIELQDFNNEAFKDKIPSVNMVTLGISYKF